MEKRSKNPAAEWHTPSAPETGLEKSGKWPVPGIVPPSGDKSQLKKFSNEPKTQPAQPPKKPPTPPVAASASPVPKTGKFDKYTTGPAKLNKELVGDGFTPKPTGSKALEMIKAALDRRAQNNIPKGTMTPEDVKKVTDTLRGPGNDMNKSQYAKTEPAEVRQGKKDEKKKAEDQKARINQQLRSDTLDYVANKNGARYEGLPGAKAKKTTRDVDDKPAGSVTNPPKVSK